MKASDFFGMGWDFVYENLLNPFSGLVFLFLSAMERLWNEIDSEEEFVRLSGLPMNFLKKRKWFSSSENLVGNFLSKILKESVPGRLSA